MINTDTYSIYIDGDKYNVYNDYNKFTVGKIYRADTYGATVTWKANTTNLTIEVSVTDLAKRMLTYAKNSKLYLTIDIDCCYTSYCGDDANYQSQMHMRRTIRGVNNSKGWGGRLSSWICPSISSPGHSRLKQYRAITNSTFNGSFNINDLITYNFLGRNRGFLNNVCLNYNKDVYMDYKFVFFVELGNGRFVHVETTPFRINDIFCRSHDNPYITEVEV